MVLYVSLSCPITTRRLSAWKAVQQQLVDEIVSVLAELHFLHRSMILAFCSEALPDLWAFILLTNQVPR